MPVGFSWEAVFDCVSCSFAIIARGRGKEDDEDEMRMRMRNERTREGNHLATRVDHDWWNTSLLGQTLQNNFPIFSSYFIILNLWLAASVPFRHT